MQQVISILISYRDFLWHSPEVFTLYPICDFSGSVIGIGLLVNTFLDQISLGL